MDERTISKMTVMRQTGREEDARKWKLKYHKIAVTPILACLFFSLNHSSSSTLVSQNSLSAMYVIFNIVTANLRGSVCVGVFTQYFDNSARNLRLRC